jgi:protein YIPF6
MMVCGLSHLENTLLTLIATLNDLDDPLESAPLTGNIQSSSSRGPLPQSYLNNTIQGEDRRAALNTIDESVWDTLSRDLLASWKKMKLVLWPKHLFGGLLQRDGGVGAAERGEGANVAALSEGIRGITSRIQDTDALLQSQMSDELRDWDLW